MTAALGDQVGAEAADHVTHRVDPRLRGGVRLDRYRTIDCLPQPDLIKIDVQGYELEALRGSMGTLRMVEAIISEVSFEELYEGQCLLHQLASWVSERGFDLHAFGVTTPLGQPLVQTDVLFLRRESRPKKADGESASASKVLR